MQSIARSITPEEVDRESDDDDVEDDAEQPVDGDAEGHKTTRGPTTDACSGDSHGVVAGERVLEHGTVAAAGGHIREGRSADDDVEAVSPRGGVQRAANAGGDFPWATGTSGDGGHGEGEREQRAPTTEPGPAEIAQCNFAEGHEHGDQREDEVGPANDDETRAGEEGGACEDTGDAEGAQTSGSEGSGWEEEESEHEEPTSEASWSTDCSQRRRRVHPAERPTLGKWDSGQRDPRPEKSPKRRCTGGAAAQARECTLMWMCPEGLRRTGLHTGGTWSRRLNRGADSSFGALCCPRAVRQCIAGVALPTAPRQWGSALQELHCPLPPGSEAAHCRSSTAHCPRALRQCIAGVAPSTAPRQWGSALQE